MNEFAFENITTEGGGFDGFTWESPGGAATFLVSADDLLPSLLLQTAGGLIEPERGDIYFNGRLLSGPAARGGGRKRSEIGFLFPNGGLILNLTLLDNLLLPLQYHFAEKKDAENLQSASALIERFGLGEMRHTLASELSPEQRKLCGFARALITAPRALLLMQPLAECGTHAATFIADEIQRLRQGQVTLLIDERDRDDLMQPGDLVATLTPSGGEVHEINSSNREDA